MAVRLPDFIIKSGGKTSGSGSGSNVYAETPSGTLDGSNTLFTLTYSPVNLPAIWLFLNGVFQEPTSDFTVTGSTITYAVAPSSTDEHFIIYFIGAGTGPVPGTARQFAGSTDAVDWGNADTFRIIGDISFGAWVKFSSSSQGMIVSQGKAHIVDVVYELAVTGSAGSWDLVYLHGYNGAGATENHTFTCGIPNGQWVFVAFVRDVSSKTVKLYVRNGTSITLIGTFSYTNNPNAGASANARLQIGNYFNGPGGLGFEKSFIGTIQEYYLWNRTLTGDELLAASNGTPSATGLLLKCLSGNTPEINLVTGENGAVTGTTLVQGHS